MTVALRGNISDFGIGEVFQLIGQQRKSGVLEVEHDGAVIHVSFAEGSVVSAATQGPDEHAALGDMLVRVGLLSADLLVAIERECATGSASFRRLLVRQADLSAQDVTEIDELVTRETIFALLRWRAGSFHFLTRPVSRVHENAQLLPAEQILMDGLRTVDEWRSLDPAATDDSSVFQRTGRFETYVQQAASDSREQLAAAERMLLAVDGRLTTRQLIDRSRLGSFEGARLLSGLRRAGVIEAIDPEVLSGARVRRRTAELGSDWLRTAAFLALPFALLLTVALLAGRSAERSAPDAHFPVARDPLLGARSEFETRRLRNLVEARRWITGEWPEHLGQLVDEGWLDGGALASHRSDAYYYYRREADGALLLAPDR